MLTSSTLLNSDCLFLGCATNWVRLWKCLKNQGLKQIHYFCGRTSSADIKHLSLTLWSVLTCNASVNSSPSPLIPRTKWGIWHLPTRPSSFWKALYSRALVLQNKISTTQFTLICWSQLDVFKKSTIIYSTALAICSEIQLLMNKFSNYLPIWSWFVWIKRLLKQGWFHHLN